jgi:macrolide transport system ATP-binding/permease protein
MDLIRLENISKTYYLGEVDVPALKDISLTIKHGEMVALMGASGSGKTTLMNILGCLDHPTSGKYWFDGEDLSELTPNGRAMIRTTKIGFVFQNFNLLPRTSALQNVIMPLDYAIHRPAAADARQLGDALLKRLGLADRSGHEPSQMSGGQQQRVAIARSLVNQPLLLLADEPTGNLDSHTSVEILEMFQQLNAEGITVILVTHDPKVATYAHRTIMISDGVVASDKVQSDGNGNGRSAPGSNHEPINGSSAIPAHHLGDAVQTLPGDSGVMTAVAPPRLKARQSFLQPQNIKESAVDGALPGDVLPKVQAKTMSLIIPHTCISALNAIKRNKMRSTLSALGVIIAVGAVIAMMEIGQGSKNALQKSIATMGANMLMVHPGAATSSGINFGSGSVVTLTPQDAEAIVQQCPAVVAAAPIVRARAQLVYGSRNWVPMQISGTTPAFLTIREWADFSEGQIFSDRDVANGSKVCVIGATIKRELFQDESPVGKDIRINNISFKVLGVLSPKGANMMGMDQDDIVIAPWTTIKYRVSGTNMSSGNQSAAAAAGDSLNKVNTLSDLYPGATALYPVPSTVELANTPQLVRFTNVNEILIKAASTEEIPQALNEITAILRERHRISAAEDDDFHVRNMTEFTDMLTGTSKLMSALLLIVALISLIVGGVGIMNIMLVSVTERTREIGLRMAVGARSYHILRQFLIEAVVLCLFGGAFGILLGRGASFMVRAIMKWPTEISLMAIIAAVAVSATVGVVFGFYPAWKASRLDPIEALRYE